VDFDAYQSCAADGLGYRGRFHGGGDFTNNYDTVQLSAVIVIVRSTQEAIVVNCRQLYPLSKPGTSS
jgi:hypothetical protein